MPSSGKPVNPLDFNWFRAFRERLEVEGGPERVLAWERRAAEFMQETGLKHKAAAMTRTAPEFGYEDAKHERMLWDKRHNVSSRLLAEATREQKSYDEALAMLPPNAPHHKEIEWIRSHPAMGRPARKAGDSGPPLTADDILAPPHGRAPSQSAVQQLIVWAQKPADFYKQIYGGKFAASLAASTAEADEGESLAAEQQTIDQTLDVLRQFSARAAKLAAEAIGMKAG